MPTVQSAELWRESGRYDAYGKEMLRLKDRHEREMLYGPTAEEMVTEIFRASVRSYKDLPKNLYQISWKFRDEVRPRFGTMRSREFLMKDAYSFDFDQAGARHAYNKMFVAYLRTFAGLGLQAIPMRADTGPIGGDLSHEFIILAQTGESAVFCDKAYLDMAIPRRRWISTTSPASRASWTPGPRATPRRRRCTRRPPSPRSRRRAASPPGHRGRAHLLFRHQVFRADGSPRSPGRTDRAPVHMGSYGIGPSRLVAAIIEASHDEAGIIWPDAVAPFDVALINLKVGDAGTDAACAQIQGELEAAGLSVLYDDRDERPGAKFATADLIGLPWQVIVGPKGLAEGKIELKRRAGGERESLASIDLLARIKRV